MTTIKARIALSVSSSGRWDASGGSVYDRNPEMALGDTRIEAEDGGAMAQYWIEVEIPLPQVAVVTASLQEAKP